MLHQQTEITKKQYIFREIVFGTLIYSVVLGFFNDYTNILQTSSYSVTFSIAFVMQLLTLGTFQLKHLVASYFKKREGWCNKAGLAFFVWLILFLSKFIFLAVIEFIFNENVEISGFIGIFVIIISMTVTMQIIERLYKHLAG